MCGMCQARFVRFVGVMTPIGCGQGVRELWRKSGGGQGPIRLRYDLIRLKWLGGHCKACWPQAGEIVQSWARQCLENRLRPA